jgi:hypothetical protein
VKSLGDGFLAMFDGPARAIHCASAIRDSLHGLNVPVRIGAHTGEVELAENDVRGIAVHIASRVALEGGATSDVSNLPIAKRPVGAITRRIEVPPLVNRDNPRYIELLPGPAEKKGAALLP